MTATSPPRAEFFRRVDSVSSTGRDGAAAVLPMALDDDGVSVCVCGGGRSGGASRAGASPWCGLHLRLGSLCLGSSSCRKERQPHPLPGRERLKAIKRLLLDGEFTCS